LRFQNKQNLPNDEHYWDLLLTCMKIFNTRLP